MSFSQEVLDRERQRNRAGGSGGSNAGGNPNDMTGGPGGMGKKSSSTSQLSAAGNVKCDAYPKLLDGSDQIKYCSFQVVLIQN